jgi:predicted amidohydrolase YtcJ
MPSRLLASVLAAAALNACGSTPPPHLAADVVYVGRILTLDAARPHAGALAVAGDRIVAVGNEADVTAAVGDSVRRVSFDGVAVPGLADAHVHVMGFGEQLETLDLRGLQKDEIVSRVAERAATAPDGAWVEGRGWDQGVWRPAEFPTAADLDAAVPQRPVVLHRIDAHSVWLNSAALRAASITRDTPDPAGGRIMRLPDGSPSGMLVDEAVSLVTRVMPKPTHAQLRARLDAALAAFVKLGLTSVHDAGVDLQGLELYKELLADGRLPLRVYAMALGTGETAAKLLAQDPEPPLGDHRLSVRSFKVYLDGALGSRGAELLAPYADAPGESGLVLMQDDELAAIVKGAVARGYQVNAHAIGDRAVRRALDAFERYGGPELRARRFRVEHASVVDAADLPRFAALGVIASMQPGFVSEYSRWAIDRLGPTRVSEVMPTADLVKTGAVVAAGTDYPAADSVDPLDTLYSMTTRRGADGRPEDGWLPEQRVDVITALRAMTIAPAYASFADGDLGMLTTGRLADMTVLSDDPLATAPDDLRELSVRMTIVGGVPVYQAPPESSPSR